MFLGVHQACAWESEMGLLRFWKVRDLQCEMVQVDEDLHPVAISY